MAITTKLTGEPALARFTTTVEVTFPSSYVQGEAFTPAMAGLSSLDRAVCHIINGDEAKTAEQFIAFATVAENKIRLWNLKTGKEVEAAKNTEKVKVLCVCSGRARGK